jgi:hypothetical protein
MMQEILTRVFLVGCPRSGTTLLQSMLAANSRIMSFPETHLYERLFSGRPILAALGIASHNARPCWDICLVEIGYPQMRKTLPKYAFFVRQFSEAFVQTLDKITLSQGKTVWIEKTPGHLRSVDKIEKLVNNVRFVHILRNGEDNIASMFEMGRKYPEAWGPWYGTLDQCIQRWVTDISISKDCAPKENHFLVSYEKLIENPKITLVNLCEFLGVPFEENMLSDYPKSADQLILEREPWKTSVQEPIWTERKHRFDDFLNDEQRDYIRAHLPNDRLDSILLEEQ